MSSCHQEAQDIWESTYGTFLNTLNITEQNEKVHSKQQLNGVNKRTIKTVLKTNG